MYESFYHLQANPFRLAPDPRFCFSHPSYEEAHAYLEYAFKLGEGFVIFTGRPGTGKTTLVRVFLNRLKSTQVAAASIAVTNLNAAELLQAVADAFELEIDGLDKVALLRKLRRYFVKQVKSGKRNLLIIDEAQGLSQQGLEELRMLADLQTESRYLLQIFLVGHGKLREFMQLPEMEQFQQRVTGTCSLVPLSVGQCRTYIEFRLKQVGWQGDPGFSGAAVKAIHAYSNGIPRHINKICTRLLLHGFIENCHRLEEVNVRAVADGLREEMLAPLSVNDEGRQLSQQAADPETEERSNLDLDELAIDEDVLPGQQPEFMRDGQLDKHSAEAATNEPFIGPAAAEDATRAIETPAIETPASNYSYLAWRLRREMPPWALLGISAIVALLLGLFSLIGVLPTEQDLNLVPDEQVFTDNGAEAAEPIALNAVNARDTASVSVKPETQSTSGEVSDSANSLNDAPVSLAAMNTPDANGEVDGQVLIVENGDADNVDMDHTESTGYGNEAVDSEPVAASAPASAVESVAASVDGPLETAVASKQDVPVVSPAPPAGTIDTEIEYLLEMARERLREYRLLLPEGDNAYVYYRRVEAIDPGNRSAQDGLQRIAGRYYSLAERALDRNDEQDALQYVNRGLSVQPRHTELLAMQTALVDPVAISDPTPERVDIVQKAGPATYAASDSLLGRIKAFIERDQRGVEPDHSFWADEDTDW